MLLAATVAAAIPVATVAGTVAPPDATDVMIGELANHDKKLQRARRRVSESAKNARTTSGSK